MMAELCTKCWQERNRFYERTRKQEAEIDLLKEELNLYQNGYKGGCYACEPVGMLNQKQEKEIAALRLRIKQLQDTIVAMAEEPEYPADIEQAQQGEESP
jgi:hypothetical protein